MPEELSHINHTRKQCQAGSVGVTQAVVASAGLLLSMVLMAKAKLNSRDELFYALLSIYCFISLAFSVLLIVACRRKIQVFIELWMIQLAITWCYLVGTIVLSQMPLGYIFLVIAISSVFHYTYGVVVWNFIVELGPEGSFFPIFL